MKGVNKVEYSGKEILVIDYSDSKEAEMIQRLMYARNLVLSENKRVLILSVFNKKNYATSNFVKQVEQVNAEMSYLIVKQSIVGLTSVQKWILKGLNLFKLEKNKILDFQTTEEAFMYLVEDSKSERPVTNAYL